MENENIITLYGIKNCDTIKKAQKWLTDHKIPYVFYDYKKTPPTLPLLDTFTQYINWQTLLNTRGTTWRKLSEDEKNSVIDCQSAITLMLKYPSIIKRPVLVNDENDYIIGFNEAQYSTLLLG